MGLSLSGLGSGFDWQSTISQLEQVETQQKINPLTTKRATYESKLSAWESLGSKLSSFLTAVQELKDTQDLDLFAPALSSSDPSVTAESVVSVTADTGAGTGSYDIKVTQLARAEKLQSNSVTSSDSDAGWTGSITLEGHDIALDGKSLQSIRDEINALNTGDDPSGVVASVLQVSDSDFRLILTHEDTGATGIDLTDAAGDYFQDTPLQTGLDAQFSIDGIDMTRSSNSIDDAIPGLTLELLSDQNPTTTISVDVDRDGEAIEEKIQSFVDSYNDVIDYINGQMSYDEGSDSTGGVLFGDTMVKSIKNNLQSTIVNAGLSSYGVSFDTDGKLSLDSEDLQDSLGSDFATVETAFNDLGQSLYTTLNNLTDSIDGTVTLQQKSAQDSIDRLDKKITSTQDAIDQKMAMLTIQYINMDAALNQLQTQFSYISSQLSSLSSS